jgi:hypothetical protein
VRIYAVHHTIRTPGGGPDFGHAYPITHHPIAEKDAFYGVINLDENFLAGLKPSY